MISVLLVRWHLLYSCYSNTHPGMKKSEGEKKTVPGVTQIKKRININSFLSTACCLLLSGSPALATVVPREETLRTHTFHYSAGWLVSIVVSTLRDDRDSRFHPLNTGTVPDLLPVFLSL